MGLLDPMCVGHYTRQRRYLRRRLQLLLEHGDASGQLGVTERQTVHLLLLLPEQPVRLRQLLLCTDTDIDRFEIFGAYEEYQGI